MTCEHNKLAEKTMTSLQSTDIVSMKKDAPVVVITDSEEVKLT